MDDENAPRSAPASSEDVSPSGPALIRRGDDRAGIDGSAGKGAAGSLANRAPRKADEPESFTFVADNGLTRYDHQATTLLDGRVLITGGHTVDDALIGTDVASAVNEPLKVSIVKA